MAKNRRGFTEQPAPRSYEGMSQYRPPLCFELVGKTFELVMDTGYDYELTFRDRKILSYGEKGKETREYEYDCLKADDDTYFVNFELTGSIPRAGQSFVLDMEQYLVTANYCTVGQNPRWPKMCKPEITFGAIRKEDGSLNAIRHGFTDEMVGSAIHWQYGNLEVVHVYASERYYRLTQTKEGMEKLRTEKPDVYERLSKRNVETIYEEPCNMIKVKDGIYIFECNEEMANRERGSGNDLFFLMNLNRMHDVGRSFGYNGEGIPENYTYGAFGEYYDASELLARESTEFIK
ncbi:MAG: MoaF N-terminal domain-containing protein [Oscillospiraceae bacterium]|nr:MoaF N-terminal domain-containing protein [Oscillospiraceae bacterium]